MSDIDIPLAPEDEWEESPDNLARKPKIKNEGIDPNNLSERAITYLAQIQDLQQQLEQEHLKVQRLEMAIKGFSIALQEEMEKGH